MHNAIGHPNRAKMSHNDSRGKERWVNQSAEADCGFLFPRTTPAPSPFIYMASPPSSIPSSGSNPPQLCKEFTFFLSQIEPPRQSSHLPSGSSPLNSGPQERHQGPADYSQWADLQYDFLAPPLEAFPTTVPVCQSFDTLTQSALWTEPDLSFETDWNFLSANSSTPYPAAFDDVPVMDVGSANSDGHSQPSPVSQFPAPVSTSLSSPATSQDDALSRVDSSRVEKRKLNTLAARRCRQRRVDRMKELEAELEKVRKERDDWRLKCSKLEGETDALKGLLTRKSKDM
ncbi:hypothetical protein N7541_001045 [Penicillium brevicompactum]|uniref:BZIP domain-containing protein n=1 Tax=Penicillium brevicompactum TaxID=5074 RepID=A0A9W9V495_PENBR|nr:hypothetical protein N7541_001045 [Penicillium brevicompactum]